MVQGKVLQLVQVADPAARNECAARNNRIELLQDPFARTNRGRRVTNRGHPEWRESEDLSENVRGDKFRTMPTRHSDFEISAQPGIDRATQEYRETAGGLVALPQTAR